MNEYIIYMLIIINVYTMKLNDVLLNVLKESTH
jgi:hypothetical protein